MARRSQVFISYSHEDKAWLERLQVHLRPLEREGFIERWDDTRIQAGGKWQEEIRRALASSKVAVLLVSADFLASDFVVTEELPQLLSAAQADGMVILPVILSPSRFEQTPLGQFQALNPPSRPVVSLPRSEQEAVFVRVADAVERALSPLPASQQQAADSAAAGTSRIWTGDGPRSEGGIAAWLRQNREWTFVGVGAVILVFLLGWLLFLSRPEQPRVHVQAEHGIAAGGSIEAKDITIVGPQPAPSPDSDRNSGD
jgi:hypothetical protein